MAEQEDRSTPEHLPNPTHITVLNSLTRGEEDTRKNHAESVHWKMPSHKCIIKTITTVEQFANQTARA